LAQVLQPLNGLFQPKEYPALLVGLAEPDDAAVYRIDDQQAIISTVDFFPPVVDDPYSFGAIAAANALSDIYAMGGRPLMAINLAAFPDNLGLNILSEILRGGAEKVKEAGAVIAGGHTVTDKEPKYGLAVTGIIHPDHIITKGGAKPGDRLILTKQLGTGVITTALKQDLADENDVKLAIQGMSRLNKNASELAIKHQCHAMTDITGYSLLGHSHEMAHLGNVDFHIEFSTLKWLAGAQKYAKQDIFPGGMHRNKDYFQKWISFDAGISEVHQNLLFDPQTSGGLLIAVTPEVAENLCTSLNDIGEPASIIGHVTTGSGFIHVHK
jgi:selenide,water dikinase